MWRKLTFRDGFWFLIEAVVGCHGLALINHIGEDVIKRLGEDCNEGQ